MKWTIVDAEDAGSPAGPGSVLRLTVLVEPGRSDAFASFRFQHELSAETPRQTALSAVANAAMERASATGLAKSLIGATGGDTGAAEETTK